MRDETTLNSLTAWSAALLGIMIFTLFTAFHAFSPGVVLAQSASNSGVSLDLESRYQVMPPSNTQVSHVITLKNLNPTVKVTQLAFRVANPNLEQLVVRTSTSDNPTPQDITPASPIVTNTETSIGLVFTDDLVGQDKTRRIEIQYLDRFLGHLTPFSGYLFLPQLINPDSYDSHQVLLTLPNTHQPQDDSGLIPITNTSSDQSITTYQVTQPSTTNHTWYFGERQPVTFQLDYSLTNSSSGPLTQQIVLPPSTPFQQVWFENLEPKPSHISQDKDGNWLASYQVPPQQTLQVRVTGSAELESSPRWQESISAKDWTQSQPSWPTNSEVATRWQGLSISALLTELTQLSVTPNSDQTANSLDQALTQQQPLNYMQLNDLVITHLRAAHTPARRVVGLSWISDDPLRPVAVPDKKLHHWTEMWRDQNWWPIDPIWQITTHGQDYSTKTDLSRLTLMYQGISDTSPTLDSLVRSELTATNQVEVLPLELTIESQPLTWRGVPIPGWQELTIDNLSGRAVLQHKLELTTPNGVERHLELPPLLPYQSVKAPIKVSAQSWWQGDRVSVQLRLDEYQTTIDLQRPPRGLSFALGWPGVAVAAATICSALGAGSILVFRRR